MSAIAHVAQPAVQISASSSIGQVRCSIVAMVTMDRPRVDRATWLDGAADAATADVRRT